MKLFMAVENPRIMQDRITPEPVVFYEISPELFPLPMGVNLEGIVEEFEEFVGFADSALENPGPDKSPHIHFYITLCRSC